MEKTTFNSRSCADCRFVGTDSGQGHAICRLHAPVLLHAYIPNGQALALQTNSVWPMVTAVTDWCGKFEAKTH